MYICIDEGTTGYVFLSITFHLLLSSYYVSSYRSAQASQSIDHHGDRLGVYVQMEALQDMYFYLLSITFYLLLSSYYVS